ncbi:MULTISPECIES: NlpC/P60 family protein [unclassified Arthrobacter]|uniref:NlpC/P60 family protein n=1 Tax=unclassified Arthrobacter TaxID=235627 RepID=UPI001D14304F|nr:MULTISPECIES: NlpC/P60 family protein [unclassified Arthrobacter]MCC3276666.1 C40 family peptidase [Arthrobacter sp. zg-Y20]MCC9178447.1 C40 family peptidase [Arthrobacter sp. zg-Y750]MDK1316825.1 NlpC/P60 family protein [Arthrobacter sp. zg.Y20]WIB06760.1 NlpC/P60 family protein [Arthrobacter sp. zg-Y20]
MSSHAHGRRRAATVQTNPITALSKAVSSNAGMVGRQAAVVVAASGLVLAAGLPAQAASVSMDRQALESTPLNVVAGTVKANADADVKLAVMEAPSSTSGADYRAQVAAEEAAVAAAAEAQAQQAAATQRAAASRVAAPVANGAVQTASSTPAAPAADAVAPGNVAAGLVASAYSQIGVAQDCTAMVEKALRSVGKSVGDLAPGQFFQYGTVVGSPAPGDLVISATHVAIYVGNGQVISGGLNGMNTGLHSLSDLHGYSFVRVS